MSDEDETQRPAADASGADEPGRAEPAGGEQVAAQSPFLRALELGALRSGDRLVDVVCDGFGRPQGLAFDATGTLYVADALAGGAGLYRIDLTQERPKPELVLSAPMLVGVAFDPRGGLVLASNDTIWKLDVDLKPLSSHKA